MVIMPASPLPASADLDRWLHVWQSRMTGGQSPGTLALACADWLTHALNTPFQMGDLYRSAASQWLHLAGIAAGKAPPVAATDSDHRFTAAAWQQGFYPLLAQATLLGEAWWDSLARGPVGMEPHNARIVAFNTRQWLDFMAPSNVPWINPEIITATLVSGGANLAEGFGHFLADHAGSPQDAFRVGRDIAATPGKVVFRNALVELLHFTPTTPKVGAEPVLLVPAWIMKYYILDLSPENSLIRWLVGQGRTVFAISWRNPGADMRDTALDDYRSLGVMAALDAIQAICGPVKVHGAGYCLGGTLLAIAAATMAREGDDRLASLSLFAAQTDFTEAGELQVFISNDQLSFLDDIMQTQGFLSGAQMSDAFRMLETNERVWSHAIRDYWLGIGDKLFDLIAWNADGTRLPARMHTEYLRRLYLENQLAEGRFVVDGRPLLLDNIRLPVFAVGTERDHIAPWRSVFKLHQFTCGDLTFVLTSGGHNAGIVSEPGHPHRHFRLRTRHAGEITLDAGAWEQCAERHEGSWWTAWNAWLEARMTGDIVPPPPVSPGRPPLGDAPGTYVLER
jgi:polyhydroxyalkanoate synthase subunit PhaC